MPAPSAGEPGTTSETSAPLVSGASAGGASAKVELSPETPGAPVALRFQPQKGATLTVRVEAGAFGAVNDRVRLSRPLVVRRPG